MAINKRKKNSRQRGSKTHGWGSMKKHRGAGHRGGRGAAGSGKRGDAKKPSIWGNRKYAGNYGFKSKSTTIVSSVTLRHLENFKNSLIAEGFIVESNGVLKADLDKAGFTKLLATGMVTSKWNISISAATDGAVEKVKKAGGSVTLTGASAQEKSAVEDSKKEASKA